jgi:hypothetical protein
MVEGKLYVDAWGPSACAPDGTRGKLRFACSCGLKVYAYSGEDAAREAAHDE